jgi:hypothetical protein
MANGEWRIANGRVAGVEEARCSFRLQSELEVSYLILSHLFSIISGDGDDGDDDGDGDGEVKAIVGMLHHSARVVDWIWV